MKTWVYILKSKFEGFEKFKQFKVCAKKQIGRTLKILRNDNGG
jgi:hypothetical protein